MSSCCSRLPNPIDSGINQVCIANFSKNTQRQLQDSQGSEMPKGNCVSECIANQTKIYRGNGLIDRIHLARIFLNSVSGDREWGDIVASSVDVCINESRLNYILSKIPFRFVYCNILARVKAEELRQSANMKASFVGEILCHPISGYLLGCLNTELFKRCPNMTQSVECNALQQYTASCHIPVKYNEIK